LKKSLSILLLALLVFNMMGYSVYVLIQTNCLTENPQLDKGASLTFKVPVSLPYVSDWQSAENSATDLLHENDFYRVVSQTIKNDTLYVECQFEESARDHFWQLVSSCDSSIKSANNSRKHHPDSLMKNFLKEYMSSERKLVFFIFEWITAKTYPGLETSTLSGTSEISTPPPKLTWSPISFSSFSQNPVF